MSKPEILLIGAYPESDMVALEAHYIVHRYWQAEDKQALLAQIAPDIRAIATRGDLGVSADVMAALPKLEIVACYGVGTDAIDLAYTQKHHIHVTNTPDVLTGDVADMAVGLLLAAARQIPQAQAHVRSQGWHQQPMPLVTRVHGKQVGIVGLGRIGRAVARRLTGFECDIGYFGRRKQPDLPYHFYSDLIELAQFSEFLIVTLAASETTQNLIDADVLRALGPQGIFINVSRGSVVDETALLHALETGAIKGAGLDVFWNEPQIDPRFIALDHVVLQPHHASATVETRRAMGQLVQDNLAAHFSGKALLTPVI